MDRPIGMFDSGFGGLTVARAVIDLLPDEHLVYIGDTGRYPYGPRPQEEVREFARQIAWSLVKEFDVKAVVVACNTASAAALEDLKAELPVPVIDVVEPGAEALVRATRSGRAGVIGTVGTIGSGAYDRAVAVTGTVPVTVVPGVGAVMLCPLVLGVSQVVELVRDELDVPVLAHPALGGALRIDPALLFGTVFRLLGADMVIFPNHGGRFSYDVATCQRIAAALAAPLGGYRPALPVPAGGMTPERVGEMCASYGEDVVLLVGGALLAADDPAGAMRGFVEAVAAQGVNHG